MADKDLLRVFHDLPVTSFSGWDKVWQIEGILASHDRGYFRESATLCDSMMRDDRIAAVSDTRVSALIASPVECKAANPSAKAERAARELGGDGEYPGLWPTMFPASVISELSWWGNWLGVGIAQILWDTTGSGNVPSTSWQSMQKAPWNVGAAGVRPDSHAPPGAYKFKTKRWTPHLKVWHPQYVYWDWTSSRFVALCQEGAVMLPNTDEQLHGDGKWFVWAPRGYQYGWLRAMVRRTAHKYIMRGWNYRDWARYNERHGQPILGAIMPAGANAEAKQKFKQSLIDMANEAVLPLAQGVEGDGNSYDLKLIEATARTYQSFMLFKKELDDDIAVSWLGQNLTTEAQGGSYALGQIQDKVRIDKRIEDALIDQAFRNQVLWWDAGYNLGDPELAPIPQHQVEPPEDEEKEAKTMIAVGQGLKELNEAAPGQIDNRAILDRFGIPMRSEEELEDEADEAAIAAADKAPTFDHSPSDSAETPCAICAKAAAAAPAKPGDPMPVSGAPDGGAAEPNINLTPSAQGAIIKVNEARGSIGLPPLTTAEGAPDPDGELSIADYQAKHASVIADAAKAEKGTDPSDPPPPVMAPFGAKPGAPPPAGAKPGEPVDEKAAAAKKKADVDRKETLSLCVRLTAGLLRRATAKTKAMVPASIAKRYEFQGLKIAVENAMGSERHWSEQLDDGTERIGRTLMLHDYGFIEGVMSGDGEELDVYVGPDETARFAYVVHQKLAPDFQRHDEDKVMLGFASADAAMAAYVAHRNDGDRAVGGMSVIPMDRFKATLKRRQGGTTSKIRATAQSQKLLALVSSLQGVQQLRKGRSAAGQKRAERYADTLERRGAQRAAKIVAGDLDGLMTDIRAASGYEDLRDRVIRRYREKMNPEALAELVKRVRLMANLAGRYTAQKSLGEKR
jgi:phage gp29-like protein